MAAAIGGDGVRLVYVGDNPAKDFLAPNQLGWTTVQVKRPTTEHRRIHATAVAPAGGEAHHQIASLDALETLLNAS
jgi:putative hydrolase of the HAD superfamily